MHAPKRVPVTQVPACQRVRGGVSEREHKHRFMHIDVCMCLCVEVLAHGHVCVVTRERVVRCVHMGLSLCAGVCVCVSKRA